MLRPPQKHHHFLIAEWHLWVSIATCFNYTNENNEIHKCNRFSICSRAALNHGFFFFLFFSLLPRTFLNSVLLTNMQHNGNSHSMHNLYRILPVLVFYIDVPNELQNCHVTFVPFSGHNMWFEQTIFRYLFKYKWEKNASNSGNNIRWNRIITCISSGFNAIVPVEIVRNRILKLNRFFPSYCHYSQSLLVFIRWFRCSSSNSMSQWKSIRNLKSKTAFIHSNVSNMFSEFSILP